MATSYKCLTEGLGANNWLLVVLDSGSKKVSLAKYTRVKNVKYENGREKFTILDWPYANQTASVKAISPTKSRFTKKNFESGGVVVFEVDKNRLKYGGSGWIKTYTDSGNPIPKGNHDIWVPDYPHPLGDGYLTDSKYAVIWFRLGKESSSRYLHVGNVSLGCVSVGTDGTSATQGTTTNQRHKYTNVAEYLLLRRKNSKHCGTLKVI